MIYAHIDILRPMIESKGTEKDSKSDCDKNTRDQGKTQT
jgi:hypothetical protein